MSRQGFGCSYRPQVWNCVGERPRCGEGGLGRGGGPVATVSGTKGQCWELPSCATGKAQPAARQPRSSCSPGLRAHCSDVQSAAPTGPWRSQLLSAGTPEHVLHLPRPSRPRDSGWTNTKKLSALEVSAQIHEHLHVLFGHSKAAGEQKFVIFPPLCPATLFADSMTGPSTIITIRIVQHLVQPSLVWDSPGKAQICHPPLSEPPLLPHRGASPSRAVPAPHTV